MGREIRMVAANWEHPKGNRSAEQYNPLFDGSYEEAAKEFMDMVNEKGLEEATDYFGQAPKREDYMPSWADEEKTHYQVYETVSEGTPVSPHFATKEELVEYLVTNGDFWDQDRRYGSGKGWNRDSAIKFVNSGYAPSMISTGDGKILMPGQM